MVEVQSNPVEVVHDAAIPLNGTAHDYDALLRLTAGKTFVLLGEASHGTDDFYRARADITKRLIREQKLNAIAIEGDWPSVYRVNRYVRGIGADASAAEALGDFRRFPLWMWRNTVMQEFVQWLRDYNDGQSAGDRVGVYGLDMYSLYESMAAVLDYLEDVDPAAAAEARDRYRCLDDVGDERRYGRDVYLGRLASCEQAVIEQLQALRDSAGHYLARGGMEASDEQFQAEQNAVLVKNAEAYYRSVFYSDVSPWNLRDRHMSDTLDALHKHLSSGLGRSARIALWAHNSHLGDARATGMGDRGDLNVGQLTRERYGDDCLLVGFTTFTGTVTAASDWDGPAECKAVRPGLPGSYEALLHEAGPERLFLPLRGDVAQALGRPRLERAIGVIYRPDTERASHYFQCRLPRQFDALIHFDRTRALRPLDAVSEWQSSEPSTYPSGL